MILNGSVALPRAFDYAQVMVLSRFLVSPSSNHFGTNILKITGGVSLELLLLTCYAGER
jgi:hypothetical protein